jgi:hypothetical protein
MAICASAGEVALLTIEVNKRQTAISADLKKLGFIIWFWVNVIFYSKYYLDIQKYAEAME